VRSSFGFRRALIAITGLGIFGVLGGLAYAAIPDGAGVIHGCYRTSTDDQKGQLRVVEDPASCRSNEQPIQWNEQGAPGADGPAGQDGSDGISPTVAQLAAGDPNCPAGGAAITDAAGTTAYVCGGQNGEAGADGEPFAGTFTSPNGQYSITVADAGIALLSPDSSIRLEPTRISVETTGADDIVVRGGSAVTVESGSGLELRSGAGTTVRSSAALLLESGAGASFESGGVMQLQAPLVRLNAVASCSPAARLGDAVNPATSSIVTGSSVVCIG
jgi:hypothetical protein